MKLSMWMIINRLSDFNINWYIESDSRPILKSARMTYAPQCLQISQMGDDVICRGGDRDYFLLEGMDYKQAFEVLQGIFDYYNDWDEQIRNAARAGAYQSIVDCSWPIFHNPLALSDGNNQAIALSSQYGAKDVDQEWQYLKEYGFSSIESVDFLKVFSQNIDNSLRNIPQILEPKNSRIRYNLANQKVFWKDELCARLVLIEKDRTLNPGDLQLLRHIAEIIAPYLGSISPAGNQNSYKDVFAELIQDGTVNRESIERHIRYNHWEYTGPFRVYAIEPRNPARSDYTLHLLRRIVLKLMPYTSVNIIQTSLVVIAREESEPHRNLVDILTRAWASEKVNIGASLVFRDIYLLPFFYRQAEYSLARLKQAKAPGTFFFSDCAMDFLVLEKDPENMYYACHPDVLCIHQADETEKTEFLKTLAVYLSCERNITHAAKELFIHRNTLIYRLKKINEMLTADLDDPYTRDYIRFSIYIVRILTGQNSLKKS